MAYITTLLQVGNMLDAPIPTRLVRELGLVKRQRVVVERRGATSLLVTPLEDYLRERSRLRERQPR